MLMTALLKTLVQFVTVIKKLELSTNKLFPWFRETHIKANTDKCYLLGTCNTKIIANVEYFNVKNSTEEKAVGIKFDIKLTFENHASSLCTKTTQKQHALTRIVSYMDIEEC